MMLLPASPIFNSQAQIPSTPLVLIVIFFKPKFEFFPFYLPTFFIRPDPHYQDHRKSSPTTQW